MTLPTTEQVLALAADGAAAKAGQSQASPRHWSALGHDDRALWGLCQGSGKLPYQVRVSLPDLASNCSCPSRKFPCKHALGLMLLGAGGTVGAGAPPDYVAEWLGKRDSRAASVAAKRDAPAAADPGKTDERASRRDRRIDDGLAELKSWIEDLVLTGFAHATVREPAFWETRAKRLIDAQAPGLARRIGDLHGVVLREADWPTRLLGELALIYLACEAYARREQADSGEVADLLRCIGQAQRQDDIDVEGAIGDVWTGLGQVVETVDKLQVQRTWLRGEASGRTALVLHFAVGNQPLPAVLLPGRRATLRLGFYPSKSALRASVLEPARDIAAATSPHGVDIAAALDGDADALAIDPWSGRVPIILDARLARDGRDTWWLVDAGGAGLPLREEGSPPWEWLAQSGGRPSIWSAEFDGRAVQVMHRWSKAAA